MQVRYTGPPSTPHQPAPAPESLRLLTRLHCRFHNILKMSKCVKMLIRFGMIGLSDPDEFSENFQGGGGISDT